MKRGAFAYSIIGLLIIGSFVGIIAVANYQAKIANVYPQVDCGDIESAYSNKLAEAAYNDYEFITDHNAKSSGVLGCFCKEQKDLGVETDTVYFDKDGSNGVAICESYYNDILEVFFWTSALSYSITGINYVLRMVCIMLVTWIGYKDETEQLI